MARQEKLDALKREMARASLPLKSTATNIVFGEGDPHAKLFFIGEAPGKNEDIHGLPFVGSAGRHLDALFDSVGLRRGQIYLTSILKYRPPRNRPPNREEIKTHTPFLVRQIEIVDPKFIIPLGNFATKFVLSGFDVANMVKIGGISTLHGKVKIVQLRKKDIFVFPLYHPAALLYNMLLKKSMFHDFKKLSTICP